MPNLASLDFRDVVHRWRPLSADAGCGTADLTVAERQDTRHLGESLKKTGFLR